ncbi:hypothetical protein PIB30_036775 [Stylosanthes scabra]|uniref:Uncharacterized protein n=1 Tax=Stylosanthes scabra TaxID=79078 RepID=A0ABU6VBR9_9FABA|nr:hypothetical protein [Stylosanthes scabra]
MASVGEFGAISSSKTSYEWVSNVVWNIPTKFVDVEGVRRLGPPSSWVKEGSQISVEFLPCLPTERVCHKGPSGGWFFMYTCVLAEIGVGFHFTSFECLVLRQINCAPSQIHPNAWGYMRAYQILMEYLGEFPSLERYVGDAEFASGSLGVLSFQGDLRDFKEFYIKVRSTEDSFPFFLNEHLVERFPLYWNKRPVQCLGVEELSDHDADLVEFLFINLKGSRVLNTAELLKWDSDRQSAVTYLEKKIPDCNIATLKSFFKQRAEKDLSSSHVVKIEKGVEVEKPIERKRPDVSLKEVADFTRSQEGLHGFNGTEDLSSLWCGHFPFTIVADEHFRSKADLELLRKIGKVSAARYMQVEAARLMCISRDWEVQVLEEENLQKSKITDLVESREQSGGALWRKKEAEVSKKAHGFEMFAAAWDRAKAQIELLVPGADLKKMDPVKVVCKGELVDDDQVPAEESGDHDPAE